MKHILTTLSILSITLLAGCSWNTRIAETMNTNETAEVVAENTNNENINTVGTTLELSDTNTNTDVETADEIDTSDLSSEALA